MTDKEKLARIQRRVEITLARLKQDPELSKAAAGMADAGRGALSLLGKGALITGGGVATGLVLNAANSLYRAITQGMTKSRDFSKMVQAHPELRQLEATTVHRAFNTLHKFNPEMASDPFVAASFVKKVNEFGMVDHKTVSELMSARKAHMQAQPKLIDAKAMSGFEARPEELFHAAGLPIKPWEGGNTPAS